MLTGGGFSVAYMVEHEFVTDRTGIHAATTARMDVHEWRAS